MPYTSDQLAVLVPTKDRPHKIRLLLQSLVAQTRPSGRIIIVDGGDSVASVVAEFADRLPVEHHVCTPPGQIRQRVMGIGLLDERTPLVALLDDDIELSPSALEEMVAFWNRIEPETAAVSFNIVNTPPEPNTPLRRLFFLAGRRPGQVLRSGMCTSNCQVTDDWRVEWVCGGATVWRAEVLRQFPQRVLPSKWAIAEDIAYSYPVGQQLPLYVSSRAQVRHEHVFDYRVNRPHRFHGYTQTLWLFYFVESNRGLSRAAFLWMTVGVATGRMLAGLLGRPHHLQFARGQFAGLRRGLMAIARGDDLGTVIARDAERFA
jgi:glycosyltransferase involved in cell wall biosynthesis